MTATTATIPILIARRVPCLAAFTLLLLLLLLKCVVLIHASPYPPPEESCGLYLAPSTIPNAGIGIFTAKAKFNGDNIGENDMCIPLVDLKVYNTKKNDFFWPFSEYVWKGEAMGMQQEASSWNNVKAYCPGLNCAVNCHAGLINVNKGELEFESGGLHRSTHPGAGAITPYHNATTSVIHDIPAGGELFKYYGDGWFTTRTDEFGLVPLASDHRIAQRLVSKLDHLTHNVSNPDLRRDLWSLVNTIGHSWESRTTHAFPQDYAQLTTVLQSSRSSTSDGIRSIHQPQAIRDLAFLQQYGRCIDHIEPRARSTIHEAGHGAFARHYLPKGTVITASPLLVVVDRAYLNMNNNNNNNNNNNTSKKQLLLNYCYGHDESSLLLCPYSSAVNYMNHNKTRANVKIQWAPEGIASHNTTWLKNLTVDDMKWIYKSSLAIEYVAVRDVLPNQELFLDYGHAWEEAWQRHVAMYRQQNNNNDINYAPAVDWNRDRRMAPIRTHHEQQTNPYPSHIMVRCHPYLLMEEDKLRDLSRQGARVKWKFKEKGVPCTVVSRYSTNTTTTNRTLYYYRTTVLDKEKRRTVQRSGVPREALRFVDRPYSTDIHLAAAFRQEIGFPDDMVFPEQWRNLKKKKRKEERDDDNKKRKEERDDEKLMVNQDKAPVMTSNVVETVGTTMSGGAGTTMDEEESASITTTTSRFFWVSCAIALAVCVVWAVKTGRFTGRRAGLKKLS